MSIAKTLRWHGRCLAAVASSYFFGNGLFLSLIGGVNRGLLGNRITGVFLLYPARREYADALAYRWHQRRFAWRPGLVGAYRQSGEWGLIFGIPDMEETIRDDQNADHVRSLMSRLDAVRARTGAERAIFAGILPSRFAKLGIENGQLEAQRRATARAVLAALDVVMAENALQPGVPIAVLGGRGYIASEVIRQCPYTPITSIDLGETGRFADFAKAADGKPAIVINLAKSSALAEYAPGLWPGVIVLNEVYPEPSPAELALLASRGATCFHIVGVPGKAWPAFPNAYRGGIPCCAALKSAEGTAMPVIVRKLELGAGHRAR